MTITPQRYARFRICGGESTKCTATNARSTGIGTHRSSKSRASIGIKTLRDRCVTGGCRLTTNRNCGSRMRCIGNIVDISSNCLGCSYIGSSKRSYRCLTPHSQRVPLTG